MTREIDARVAREVMGLQNGNIPYSTDMNAAMEVVAQMEKHGCSRLELTFSGQPLQPEAVMVVNGTAYFRDANTPALAICLAALEAVKSDR